MTIAYHPQASGSSMPRQKRTNPARRRREGGSRVITRVGRVGSRTRARRASASASTSTRVRRSARINRRSTTIGASVADGGREMTPVMHGRRPPSRDLIPRAVEAERAREQQRPQSRTAVATAADDDTGLETSSLAPPEGDLPPSLAPIGSSSTMPLGSSSPWLARPIELEAMSQPTQEASRDEVLYPPLIIRVRVTGTNESSGALADLGQFWAVLSLIDEREAETVAPPRRDLLVGTLTDSVHPLLRPDRARLEGDDYATSNHDSSSEADQFEGYVMFSNLTIRETGRYRLRVTLIQMQLETGTGVTGMGGGSSQRELQTHVVNVRDRPREVNVTGYEGTMELLRQQGVPVPTQPD